MKRFHRALALRDRVAAITEDTLRLGQYPAAMTGGKYAMRRSDLLNGSICMTLTKGPT